MLRPSPLPFSRRAGALAALALSLLLPGCATAPAKKELPQWPLPPEKPRVRFVRAFAQADDLKVGAFDTALRVLVPSSPDAVVSQPTGLALAPDEKVLFVAGSVSGRVLRIDLAAKTVDRFATDDGKRPTRPMSVAVDGAGNVFVSDGALNVVWVYGPDGKFLRKFGEGKLDRPSGIAIDRRRQLLYAISGVGAKSTHHRVEVFSLTGEHLRTIGTRGAGPGEFNFPTNLAVARDGNVYVVDMLNFRVQIFDPEGEVVGQFGSIGAGEPASFNKAKSIAFDAFDNIYVVDSELGIVQIFNATQQPLMAFAGRAQSPGYLMVPTAIAIDSKNTIYVADYGAALVNEYQLFNTAAGDSVGSAPPPAPPAQ